MNCQRVDELLNEAPTAEALTHAKSCADCGPARAAWDAMNSTAGSSPSLLKLKEAARAELKAQPKARMWWVDALLLLALNFGVALLSSSLLSTPATHPESSTSRWGIAAALMTLMGAGAWAAIRPGARQLRGVLIGIAAVGAVWVGVGGSGLSNGRPFATGLACAITELVVSLVPLLVALWITSRFAFDVTRAIVGGLSVGATGMFVLHHHCSNGAADHLFAFHVVPWALVAIAAVAVRRMLPSRSFAS
jgi:hypothetical protein